ncbi:MAG: STAS domain-containing protein, partial [Nitriliruptoraceae bacterium]
GVHAWRIERTDGIAFWVTFLATLLIGVELGIGIGVATSLALSLWRVGVPRITAHAGPPATVFEIEGALLPASSVRLLEAVEDRLASAEHHNGPFLVLDLAGVPSMDASGVEAIANLELACRAAEVELHLASVREGVATTLRRAHLDDRFANRWHEDTPTALLTLTARHTAGSAPREAGDPRHATAPEAGDPRHTTTPETGDPRHTTTPEAGDPRHTAATDGPAGDEAARATSAQPSRPRL